MRYEYECTNCEAKLVCEKNGDDEPKRYIEAFCLSCSNHGSGSAGSQRRFRLVG